MDALMLVHLAATLALAGLIWTVQLVVYPQFARVPAPAFRAYHEQHARRIAWIVGPLMAAEGVAALAIAVDGASPLPAWARHGGLALVGLHLASTALLQVPLHRRLARGPDAAAVRRLVATNWVRTGAWSARALLALWMAARAVSP